MGKHPLQDFTSAIVLIESFQTHQLRLYPSLEAEAEGNGRREASR